MNSIFLLVIVTCATVAAVVNGSNSTRGSLDLSKIMNSIMKKQVKTWIETVCDPEILSGEDDTALKLVLISTECQVKVNPRKVKDCFYKTYNVTEELPQTLEEIQEVYCSEQKAEKVQEYTDCALQQAKGLDIRGWMKIGRGMHACFKNAGVIQSSNSSIIG